jgi:uncharacterized repeat protein (TIGR03803 family)
MRESDRKAEFPVQDGRFQGQRADKPHGLRSAWWIKVCAALALCAASAMIAPAQAFKTLLDFNASDGTNPQAALVQATDGHLYGTTLFGGANGYGDVFRITPGGALTVLYSFCSQPRCADGNGSTAGLVQAHNGNFYGTTWSGGAGNEGTVFSITSTGVLTTLYSFCGRTHCLDGEVPMAGLAVGSDENLLYGTTYQGGINGPGTVFKVNLQGVMTTLYNFCTQTNCADGASPFAGLVLGPDGNFYGTTYMGGAYSNGTVFKITPQGALTTLYSFCAQTGCADGAAPYAGLALGTDDNFYGTTRFGGAYHGGTVFKITPRGDLTTLYGFCAQTACADGYEPLAGLAQGTDGNFYGTTSDGGANVHYGTLFKITSRGDLTTLHNFDQTDGSSPAGGLYQDTNGTLYGTTCCGGTSNDGTVFGLAVGLAPFVRTAPASGSVGSSVTILGTNLTGATSVDFNGVAADFTVLSSSQISTTVPAGATSGKVQVTTPAGTLLSNVTFQVLPESRFLP